MITIGRLTRICILLLTEIYVNVTEFLFSTLNFIVCQAVIVCIINLYLTGSISEGF